MRSIVHFVLLGAAWCLSACAQSAPSRPAVPPPIASSTAPAVTLVCRDSDPDPLPEQLVRDDIKCAMKRIQPAVEDCYRRFREPGTALVSYKFVGDGTVTSAFVVGVLGGTPTGACIEGVFRAYRMPRFTGPPMSLIYPFILR